MSISFELNKPSTIDSESRISKEVLPLPAKPSSGKSRLVYYTIYIEYNFKSSSIHLKHRLCATNIYIGDDSRKTFSIALFTFFSLGDLHRLLFLYCTRLR